MRLEFFRAERRGRETENVDFLRSTTCHLERLPSFLVSFPDFFIRSDSPITSPSGRESSYITQQWREEKRNTILILEQKTLVNEKSNKREREHKINRIFFKNKRRLFFLSFFFILVVVVSIVPARQREPLGWLARPVK